MSTKDKVCPYCKGKGFMLSKIRMIIEILKIAGFKESRSPYSDANLTKEELFTIYSWMKEADIQNRKDIKMGR